MNYLYIYGLKVPYIWFDVSTDERNDEEVLRRLKKMNGDNLRFVKVYKIVGEEKEFLATIMEEKEIKTECKSCERRKQCQ